MSSPSNQNVVSPTPQPKRVTAAARAVSAGGQHPIQLFPSYAALVCDQSSITKSDLIKSLAGKCGSKLSISKDAIRLALLLIVEKQQEFCAALGKVDKSSMSSDSSAASSLQGAFLTDFPFGDDGKFKRTKGSIANSNKEELATLMVNFYKLVELAKKSKHFRQLVKHVEPINALVKKSIEHVREQKEEESEPRLLRGEKRTGSQLSRKYCQGGGFKPADLCYQICIFCKHQFIDEAPENKNVFDNNRKKEEKYEELRKEFEAFKNGTRATPPIGPNGKAIRKRLPPIKKDSLILQCHCFQMQCAQENSDVGSSCELKCCDPTTGNKYKWEKVGILKKCTCPICTCSCRKAYKLDNIQAIMGVLAREDGNVINSNLNNQKMAEKQQQLEARDFISKSLRFGYQQRDVYRNMIDKMKSKGKYPCLHDTLS